MYLPCPVQWSQGDSDSRDEDMADHVRFLTGGSFPEKYLKTSWLTLPGREWAPPQSTHLSRSTHFTVTQQAIPDTYSGHEDTVSSANQFLLSL